MGLFRFLTENFIDQNSINEIKKRTFYNYELDVRENLVQKGILIEREGVLSILASSLNQLYRLMNTRDFKSFDLSARILGVDLENVKINYQNKANLNHLLMSIDDSATALTQEVIKGTPDQSRVKLLIELLDYCGPEFRQTN